MSGGAAARPRASLLGFGIATALLCAVLVGLGVWQLERKTWKEGLIAAIEARAFAPPEPVVSDRDWAAWSPATGEYRHVQLTGTFLHDGEVAVHGIADLTRGQGTLGFYIFTPLRLADGSLVVINRGFVPAELKAAASRPDGNMPGPVTVTGLLRAPETRGMFVPANDLARDEWFVRELADMTRARGLVRAAPFYVDADATPNAGGWPRGGQTRLTLPDNHLGYALTWFTLAAALLAVAVLFAKSRLTAASPATGKRPTTSDRPS